MEHVKFRVNLRGPPRKAKYSWMSDSEKYREGMVKRTSEEEWKEREIASYQTEDERLSVLLRACWRMFRRLIVSGRLK